MAKINQEEYEVLKDKLKYYEQFYYNVWGSGWISSDVTYDIDKQTKNDTGVDIFEINNGRD